MANLNRTEFIGRLTADPEMKYTSNNTARTTFRIAVNRYYKDASGEKQEETTYVPIVCWAKLAENVSNYTSKGREVFVDGRLRIYKGDKVDEQGNSKWFTEIVANQVLFLGGKPDNDTEAKPAAGATVRQDAINMNAEDMPF